MYRLTKCLVVALIPAPLPLTAAPASAAVTSGPGGSGVTAGNSDLIGDYDYTETWTIGATATVPARVTYPPQGFPLPAGVAVMENTHGNPAVSWSTRLGSIATDASNFPTGASPYPGGTGSGSATGFTQTGAQPEMNFTIAYGLRNDFIVQTDTLLATDRTEVFLNDVGFDGGLTDVTAITDNVGLAVFFRDDTDTFPKIGVYNGVSEIDTGLTTGLPPSEQERWHNFAVQFDLDNGLLAFWVDEVSRGTFDFATAFPNLNPSNAFIGIGSAGSQNRLWTDNFQVGAAGWVIPEPCGLLVWSLLVGLGIGAGWRRRRRNAA